MNYYLTLAALLFGYMSLWFVVSLVKKRNDVADVAWGLGFVFLSWFSFLISDDHSWRALVVNILVTIWGVRLSWHIYRRNRRKPEDPRYRAWRDQWGAWFLLRSYFQVYILQGILLLVIVFPVLVINQQPNSMVAFTDVIGSFLWMAGFLFEAAADAQLARFLAQPQNKGKLMQQGLWKYSRHPNYFGEITQWWGIFIIALGSPLGWLTVISPLTITILIRYVSGVPLLEKQFEGRADFEAYKQRTSVLFPLPPSKRA